LNFAEDIEGIRPVSPTLMH